MSRADAGVSKIVKDHISVCICTYQRNLTLEHLLRNLSLQETAGLFDFSAVVVDNDVNGPARETVERMQSELGMKIQYAIEPEQTIPAARNRALSLARGNYIGIIDDDEFPPQHWLLTLFRALQVFNVDGVLGPVHPFFDKKPPAWLLKSRICERPVYRTGTLLEWPQTRTGNVLLKRELIEEGQLSFDLNMKTGGSDQVFFRQAIDAGYRFIAVAEAPVYERISYERQKKSYYLKRSLVQGQNNKVYMGQLRGFFGIPMALRSAVASLGYAIALPFSACLGGHLFLKCLQSGAYHMSTFLTLFGIELVKKRNF
jgi:glycosyltransferase involved in cell wall biosynthesis